MDRILTVMNHFWNGFELRRDRYRVSISLYCCLYCCFFTVAYFAVFGP